MAAETLELRDYQKECSRSVFDAIERGIKRPAVVLPTGGGKTIIFSDLGESWTYAVHIGVRKGRMLILVHTEELIAQAVHKLHMVAPHLNVGVVQAKRDEHLGADIIVGSVQTLRKLPRLDRLRSSGPIGLVVVDECHHATAASYRTIMGELGCFDADSPTCAVGFTATLKRSDKASLGDVWQEVCFQRDILDMINDGWLCDVKGKLVTVDGLSLAQVATSGGDYQVASLSDALLSSDTPEFIAKAYSEHALDRPGVLFSPTVETAHVFSEALNSHGIRAVPVWGSMPAEERRDAIQGAHDGKYQVLTNCMVLTEGFDWPAAEVAVIARPTMSAALYVQMAGRVLRPLKGKKEALILDIVGASEEHRLATLADLTTRRIKQIQLGESLAEAAKREKRERNPLLRDYVVGYRDMDLFNKRTALWQQTYEGIWFVAMDKSLFFLWPSSEPGLYHVGVRRTDKKGGMFTHKNVTQEIAMAWVEAEVRDIDLGFSPRAEAAWRRKKEPATEAQKIRATRLGLGKLIEANPGITKREISDAMNVHTASKVLDWALKKARK